MLERGISAALQIQRCLIFHTQRIRSLIQRTSDDPGADFDPWVEDGPLRDTVADLRSCQVNAPNWIRLATAIPLTLDVLEDEVASFSSGSVSCRTRYQTSEKPYLAYAAQNALQI